MERTPRIEYVPIEALRPAPWNFKVTPPDAEDRMRRLCESIRADRSAGVLAVRVNEAGDLEVIDGNHRLEAIRRLQAELGWKQVPVENYGPISREEALLIALRRNSLWFDIDPLALGTELLRVYTSQAVQDIVARLERFTPYDAGELRRMLVAAESYARSQARMVLQQAAARIAAMSAGAATDDAGGPPQPSDDDDVAADAEFVPPDETTDPEAAAPRTAIDTILTGSRHITAFFESADEFAIVCRAVSHVGLRGDPRRFNARQWGLAFLALARTVLGEEASVD